MEPNCISEDVTIGIQLVPIISQLYSDTTVTGILQPSNDLTEDGDFAFCAALATLTQSQVTIHVDNFTDHPHTLKRSSHIANFSVMTPE